MAGALSDKAKVDLRSRLNDRRWRIGHLYHQVDKDGNDYLFVPKPEQRTLLDGGHPMELILKARQLGFTTLSCVEALDNAMFRANCANVIQAHKREDADRFMREKIRYAWENLDPDIQQLARLTKNEGNEMRWEHGSSIRTTTSARSGTVQFLHLSEFGILCIDNPERAAEVVTGSINSVSSGGANKVRIESTAKGESGYFWQYCMNALSMQRQKRRLTPMDWKLFFFPWFNDPTYQLHLEEDFEFIVPEYLQKYFEALQKRGIELSVPQQRWYVKKVDQMTLESGGVSSWGRMKKEYPSFPEEAFEQTVDGAYYTQQMEFLEREGRITQVPYHRGLPVDTWWDIGLDGTAIWFTQDFGTKVHVLRCYVAVGEALPHFVTKLKEFSELEGYIYNRVVMPHDGDNTDWATGITRVQQAQMLMPQFTIEAVERTALADGIELVRSVLPLCWFDEAGCAEGLKALKTYRKQFDQKAGIWREKPVHGPESHPADAFRTFATNRQNDAWQQTQPPPPPKISALGWS